MSHSITNIATTTCKKVIERSTSILTVGVLGAFAFVWVQVLTGSTNIADFIGQKIVETGGYDPASATAIGWSVHLTIAIQYAFAFATLLALPILPTAIKPRIITGLATAVAFGFVTTWIANPAISATISLLGGQGLPDQLFPINWKLGVPLFNHIGFFVATLIAFDWLPALTSATSKTTATPAAAEPSLLGVRFFNPESRHDFSI